MKKLLLLSTLITTLAIASAAMAEGQPETIPAGNAPGQSQDMKSMQEMHDGCMGEGKGMGDMKGMHDQCMQHMKTLQMSGDKKEEGAKQKPAGKTGKHRRSKAHPAPPAPGHDHNHGASPTP